MVGMLSDIARAVLSRAQSAVEQKPEVRRIAAPEPQPADQSPRVRRRASRAVPPQQVQEALPGQLPLPAVVAAPEQPQPAPVPQGASPARSRYANDEEIPDGEPFSRGGQRYVWVRREEDGSRYRKNITGMVRNPQAAPTPGIEEMAAITATQASMSARKSIRAMDNEMHNPKDEDETRHLTR